MYLNMYSEGNKSITQRPESKVQAVEALISVNRLLVRALFPIRCGTLQNSTSLIEDPDLLLLGCISNLWGCSDHVMGLIAFPDNL